MSPGAKKMAGALVLVLISIILEATSPYSPDSLLQLVFSLALAIAGALVAVRGIIDFLSERF